MGLLDDAACRLLRIGALNCTAGLLTPEEHSRWYVRDMPESSPRCNHVTTSSLRYRSSGFRSSEDPWYVPGAVIPDPLERSELPLALMKPSETASGTGTQSTRIGARLMPSASPRSSRPGARCTRRALKFAGLANCHAHESTLNVLGVVSPLVGHDVLPVRTRKSEAPCPETMSSKNPRSRYTVRLPGGRTGPPRSSLPHAVGAEFVVQIRGES